MSEPGAGHREEWAERVRSAYACLPGGGTVEPGFGPLGVDVVAEDWPAAAALARDTLGLSYFDWLSAVDEGEDGIRVVAHLARHRPGAVEHLLQRTLLPAAAPVVGSVVEVYAGAGWHERETHEMFGVDFSRDGRVLDLAPLLLPDEFAGHPLRKDFVLVSRVVRPWPGAKEPGESDATRTTSRRRARPPGVPDPAVWGPRREDGDG
ncbi:MAG: NADH-quinone oxidoreductase subunit C [Nocardioidaceae bacterium]